MTPNVAHICIAQHLPQNVGTTKIGGFQILGFSSISFPLFGSSNEVHHIVTPNVAETCIAFSCPTRYCRTPSASASKCWNDEDGRVSDGRVSDALCFLVLKARLQNGMWSMVRPRYDFGFCEF